MQKPRYKYIEWSDVDRRSDEIVQMILDRYIPGSFELVGIARGGMIPAVLVAYKLNVAINMLDISSFKDGVRGSINDKTLFRRDPAKHLVIIDDIFDTGTTANYVQEKYENSSLYFIIDKRIEDPENKYWYVFPWDPRPSE
jgi:hypoxanthine phosphoribosyltransferase